MFQPGTFKNIAMEGILGGGEKHLRQGVQLGNYNYS